MIVKDKDEKDMRQLNYTACRKKCNKGTKKKKKKIQIEITSFLKLQSIPKIVDKFWKSLTISHIQVFLIRAKYLRFH